MNNIHGDSDLLSPTPKSNETVYDTPDLDTQARIDALKEKVRAERGTPDDK